VKGVDGRPLSAGGEPQGQPNTRAHMSSGEPGKKLKEWLLLGSCSALPPTVLDDGDTESGPADRDPAWWWDFQSALSEAVSDDDAKSEGASSCDSAGEEDQDDGVDREAPTGARVLNRPTEVADQGQPCFAVKEVAPLVRREGRSFAICSCGGHATLGRRDGTGYRCQFYSSTKFALCHMSLKKCSFLRKNVRFLGHIIGSDGLRALPDRCAAIQQWPVPKTVKDLLGFLCLCSYYW